MSAVIAPDNLKQSHGLGDKIDERYKLIQQRKELDKKSKELYAEITQLEGEILELMQTANLDNAGGKTSSVTITEQLVPTIVDNDAFNQYIIQEDALYLLQRRVVATRYKELIDAGETVPGLEPTTLSKLSQRKK